MWGNGRSAEELETDELERMLRQKKHALAPARRRRLQAMGRVVDVPGLLPPDGSLPARIVTRAHLAPLLAPDAMASVKVKRTRPPPVGRAVASHAWLLFEVVIVLVLLVTAVDLWRSNSQLNRALTGVQRAEGAALALPTPEATPVIDVVVLPGGHRYPHGGETPQPGEAGYIPAHLLPAINNYESPPVPTPAPEHARRIQIAALNVDSAIYQGMYDWEVLKKGVAQHIGSPAPGQKGNMIFAGHNDVYGEVFRDLDQLTPGDEIVVSSQRQDYVYVVRETVIVDPAEVWVMAPTGFPSLTLISCYPYRVNTKRIVVFADLAG
ncbi:MAG: sortase [Anaerolineae bacterium]|nr:sortase [Anaerolineae bacterium]